MMNLNQLLSYAYPQNGYSGFTDADLQHATEMYIKYRDEVDHILTKIQNLKWYEAPTKGQYNRDKRKAEEQRDYWKGQMKDINTWLNDNVVAQMNVYSYEAASGKDLETGTSIISSDKKQLFIVAGIGVVILFIILK